MSYYKYAEGSADSQVNWGKITRDMTTMLREQKQLRQDKRDAIDQASREYAQKLTDAPLGDSELINDFTLSYANNARQYHLMIDNLLKSGMLDPREYTLQMQNLQTGTQNLFNLSKDYSEQYATAMERLKSDDPNMSSQKLEQTLLSSIEGYAKLGNHSAYINPTNGSLSIGKMVKGPDGVDMMEAPVSVAELRNRIKSKYDYFNYKEAIDKRVNSLPKKQKIKTLYDKYGKMIVEVEDFTQFKDLNDFLELEANSMMENQFNISSILTDDLIETADGKEYFYVVEETDGQGNVIGYKNAANGESVGNTREEDMIIIRTNPDSGVRELDFTDTQKDRVREALKREVHAQLPYKETFKQQVRPEKPTAPEIKERAGQKKTDENVSMMSDLYYGDANQIKVAEQYFRDSIPGAVRVKKEEDSVVVTFGDGTTRKIEFGESFDDFAQSGGPLMLGNVNIKEAIERAGGKRFKEINGQQVELEPSKIIGIGSQEEAAPIEPSDVNSPINAKGDTIFDIIKTRDVRVFGIVDDAKLQKLGSEIEQAISSRATFLGKPELTAGITIKKNEDGDGLIAEKNGIVIDEVNLDVGEIKGLDEIKSFVNKIISKTLVVQQPTGEAEEAPAEEAPIEEKPFG